ncbi:unnamed protein product [Amoebophrya sp. A25]|nr:unnamed protein product [Amoebophrya sp. A25]|eukprot:GSA25T00006566001.1
MPLSATFTWTEDLDTVTFVVRVPAVKANKATVVLSPNYVKVSHEKHFFEQDLVEEIDMDASHARISSDKVTLLLKKKVANRWGDFRWQGKTRVGDREALIQRRKDSLAAWEERENRLSAERKDARFKLNKKAEEEQWRLDREGREKIEKWQQEEKQIAEDETFQVLDSLDDASSTGRKRSLLDDDRSTVDDAGGSTSSIFGEQDEEKASASASSSSKKAKTASKEERLLPGGDDDEDEDVDDVSEEADTPDQPDTSKTSKTKKPQDDPDSEDEYQLEVLPPVRQLPNVRKTEKMILPMTRHAKPGVPARDRPGRAPPHPRELAGAAVAKQQHRLEGETEEDETDPVWLKDKADRCMAAGDYNGALQAYTSALTEYSNARAFGNRALCAMYLGRLTQCIEDCNHSLKILNMKNKVPEGHCPPPKDPEDERLRARVFVRRGVAFLWLGDYGKANESFQAALEECEDGALTSEEREIVKGDLERIKLAATAYSQKAEVDALVRRIPGSSPKDIIDNKVIEAYDSAMEVEGNENAVLCANRCLSKLQAGQVDDCLQDADETARLLALWPVPRGAPKLPEKPQRLDPPTLEDHTFRNPVGKKAKGEDERDWLMKHSGGIAEGGKLPDIPDDFEWVRDASEKNDEAWIAVRKKLKREQIESIRAKINRLQEALYSRKLDQIDAAMEIAKKENFQKEGPSNEALHQAAVYRNQLAAFLDEQKQKADAERDTRIEEEKTSASFFERSLCATQLPGCFRRDHPVERTRRRIFVKTKLRQARAFELQSRWEDVAACLDTVLQAERRNPDALRMHAVNAERLAAMEAKNVPPSSGAGGQDGSTGKAGLAASSSSTNTGDPSSGADVDVERLVAEKILGSGGAEKSTSSSSSSTSTTSKDGGAQPVQKTDVLDDSDSEDEDGTSSKGFLNGASVKALVATGAKYLEKSETESALQIFLYALSKGEDFQDAQQDTREEELRLRLNVCLCQQKLKRVKDVLDTCSGILSKVGVSGFPRLEAACRTRRAWALNQLSRTKEAVEESKKAQELLRAAAAS